MHKQVKNITLTFCCLTFDSEVLHLWIASRFLIGNSIVFLLCLNRVLFSFQDIQIYG